MRGHRLDGLDIALAGALAAWAASCSWIPLFAAPSRFLVPGAVLAAVIGTLGWLGRMWGTKPGLIPVAQLVVCYLVMSVWFSPAAGARRPGDVPALAHALVHGAGQINTYSSPAPARFGDAAILLCGCLVLLAAAVDLVAGGLRRAAVAGLLLLLAVTVPISVLDQRMSVWVFVLTGAAYLTLLALSHGRDVRTWGRGVTSASPARAAAGLRSPIAPGSAIGALCLAGAVLASGIIPVSNGIFRQGAGNGGGSGTRGVTLSNPMIDLRRDLIQMSHTPLLTARTDDPDPSYVQLSVLDQFTGNQWRASERKLPRSNELPGMLPTAPGIGPGQAGTNTRWTMSISPRFKTSWLPVPAPVTRVDVHGDWRYDSRTLDIADVAQDQPSGTLTYHVDAFHPHYDANALNSAGTPVGDAVAGMTALPANLPSVIRNVTRRVTHGARTEYQQLVRLQRWFRSTGGFRYSTRPAPGSGMALLAAFITRDKVGYCEQFSAAMAVMARTLGIPSRVVVGFLRPTGKAPGPGEVEFTSDDLHAWPQFYFAGSGWVSFDPTPGARTGGPPAYTQQDLRTTRERPHRHASPKPTRKTRPRAVKQAPKRAVAHHHGDGRNDLWWLLLLPGALVVLLAPRVLRDRQRRRRLTVDPRSTSATLATGVWAEVRASARDLGMGWEDGRSPRQAFAVLRSRISGELDLDGARDLEWLCDYVERAWYAPTEPVRTADAERVQTTVLDLRTAMCAAVPERLVRRERWLAGSLFERRPVPGAVDDYERADA